MQEITSTQKEAAQDVFFGQVVVIWARWFIIAAGLVLALWVTTVPSELAIIVVPVVALVVVNFYLHGRYLTGRPANPALMTLVGLVDIATITVGVMFWPEGKGIFSPFFILYFPVIVAFAFVMPRNVTLAFTGIALTVYVGASLLSDAIYSSEDLYPDLYDRVHGRALAKAAAGDAGGAADIAATALAVKAVEDVKLSGGNVKTVKTLLMRLITLAAMGGLGTYYWRIQRNRRREAAGGGPDVHVDVAVAATDHLGVARPADATAEPAVGVLAEAPSRPTVA